MALTRVPCLWSVRLHLALRVVSKVEADDVNVVPPHKVVLHLLRDQRVQAMDLLQHYLQAATQARGLT